MASPGSSPAVPPLPPAVDVPDAPAVPTAEAPAQADSTAPSVDAARSSGLPTSSAAPAEAKTAAPPAESKAPAASTDATALATVFGACDADSGGTLDEVELGFALKACGLYPTPAQLAAATQTLGVSPPLDPRAFERLQGDLEQRPACRRGLKVVPYARRGITLAQLKDVSKATLATDWIPKKCE